MKGFTNAINNSKDSIETLNVTLKTNQQEHTDLVGVGFTLSYGNYTKSFTWEGNTMTIEVPAYVTYTITYEGVEDYKKPENVTFTAHGGNSRSVTALYQTELVDIALNSSDGSSVNGAVVLINGKSRTWDGNNIKQKVAFGTEYSVEPQSLSGFTTPTPRSFVAEQAVREVSFTYIASALKVNILSNQSTESSWDPTITNIKATVKYGSTTLQVSNGQQINIPSGVNVTISFPEVEGYLKPGDITFTHNGGLVEKSGTYQCELLTVNVSADSGTPTGFEVAISKQETVGVAAKYTRLEYIESSGTQYIDTGFKPNQNTKMCLDVAFLSAVGNNIAGVRNSSSDTINRFGVISFSSASKIGAFFRDSSIQAISYNTSRHSYELSKSGLIVDGTSYGSSNNGAFVCTYPITLGAWNNGEGGVSYNNSKIYGCKIYDNGTLVRDYIPALRSDGIAGLYEAVNDTFTASSGSSNFVAGSKQEEIIATQTSTTGTYKIPFNTSYTVKASNVNGYTTPASVTRVAIAKSYTVTQEYKVITVRDLSLMDVYGNPINRSTANCYVVREPGQYKFPLVYGNAIKNGKVNTAAFTNNGAANSHDFVNIHGNAISSPYIEIDMSYNLGIAAQSNEDTQGIVTDLSLEDGEPCRYLKFKVNSIPSTGANIIIGYGSDVWIWTWHIWVWPHSLSPVEITNATGVKYNIMPVNLASKYDSDGVHIKNWFYQWGRKDPMLCPASYNSSTNHSPGIIEIYPKTDDLKYGIGRVEWFYYNSSSPYNWFGDKSYYNLWDAACTGTGASDNDTVKTVYDPCPVGWKIPNGNVFTGFSTSNVVGNFNGGWKFKRYSDDTVGVFFPASGWRRYSDGSLANVGLHSYVWFSSAHSQNLAYNLYFDSSSVNPQNVKYRAHGYSVRPVQDDNIQLDVIMISFTIDGTTYQAESGMTWFEWVNSEYNTGGFFLSVGSINNDNNRPKVMYLTSTNKKVLYGEQVIGGASYYISEQV